MGVLKANFPCIFVSGGCWLGLSCFVLLVLMDFDSCVFVYFYTSGSWARGSCNYRKRPLRRISRCELFFVTSCHETTTVL